MTLASLFDGIGVWQLAAARAGITPLWSSEIDYACCQITKRHFPNTIQLGDINLISDAPKVDIITAGSPCQNLSIAGRREGLHGEKSSLFFKAVELVRRLKPHFFIWENVTGVLTSNGRLDFKTVIEEILQEPVPLPRYFSNAGLVDGRLCQIAWRLLDAQYWGVPQRRKRIFLVADFATRRAAKILFEPTSLRRNSVQSKKSQCNLTSRITFGIGRDAFNQGKNAKFKPSIEQDLQPPLTARGAAAVATEKIIRRLTPLECERLQGLPDDWTAGFSDTQRYKALGNSMALPCASFILNSLRKEIVHLDSTPPLPTKIYRRHSTRIHS